MATLDDDIRAASGTVAKSILRADAVGSALTIGRHDPTARMRIDISSVRRVGRLNSINGVELFAQAFRDGSQLGFGRDGSVDIERVLVINPPVLVPDALGAVQRNVTDDAGNPVTLRYRIDPLAACLAQLAHSLQLSGKTGTAITRGKIGQTTLIVFPNAGTGTAPVDGSVDRNGVDETFSTIRGGAGVTANAVNVTDVPGRLNASATTDQFERLARCIFGFPTASLGADKVVTGVTFSLWGVTHATAIGTPELCVVSATPGSESTLVSGDYATAVYGSTEFVSRVTTWNIGSYNDMTGNASFRSHINKSGNTIIGTRLGWDLDASFSGTWASLANSRFGSSFADETGTAQDPKLTINFETMPKRSQLLHWFPPVTK